MGVGLWVLAACAGRSTKSKGFKQGRAGQGQGRAGQGRAGQPPKSRGSVSEAAPPAKAPVWPVVVTDEPIRLYTGRVARSSNRRHWLAQVGDELFLEELGGCQY